MRHALVYTIVINERASRWVFANMKGYVSHLLWRAVDELLELLVGRLKVVVDNDDVVNAGCL